MKALLCVRNFPWITFFNSYNCHLWSLENNWLAKITQLELDRGGIQTSALWLLRPHTGPVHTEWHPCLGKQSFRKALGPKMYGSRTELSKERSVNRLLVSRLFVTWLLRKRLSPVYKSSMTLSIVFSSACFSFFPSMTLWVKAALWWFPCLAVTVALWMQSPPENRMCAPYCLRHWGCSCEYSCTREIRLDGLAGLYI